MKNGPTLVYRQRLPKDDSFIVNATLTAMREVFQLSTGMLLTEQHIRQLIDDNQTTVIIEQNKKPIGYYSYTIYQAGYMYWSSLILLPGMQDKGFGKQVVTHVEQQALSKGVRVILGHVQAANKRAVAFWLKNGFRMVSGPIQGSIEIRKDLITL